MWLFVLRYLEAKASGLNSELKRGCLSLSICNEICRKILKAVTISVLVFFYMVGCSQDLLVLHTTVEYKICLEGQSSQEALQFFLMYLCKKD